MATAKRQRGGADETGATAGSVDKHLGERGGRQDAHGPEVDLLDGRRRDALFDVSVRGVTEALSQQAQLEIA
jgi:hypothetical protein